MINTLLGYLEETNPSEANDLYVDAVRLVAKTHIKRTGFIEAQDVDEEADNWLEEIFADTFPTDHDLFYILGERDLLADHETNSWDMTIDLVEDACPYASEVDENLKNHYMNNKLNSPANSAQLIEDFYNTWRDCFLAEIHRQASGQVTEESDRGITVTVEVIDADYDPVPNAVVEMSTLDGGFESTGNETDEKGKVQFVLDYFTDDTVHAVIYLNGSSRGNFEFSGSECSVELRG